MFILEDTLVAMMIKLPMSSKRSTSGPLESAIWASSPAHLPSAPLWPSKNPTSRSGNTSNESSTIFPHSSPPSKTPSSKISSPPSLVDPPPPLSPRTPHSPLSTRQIYRPWPPLPNHIRRQTTRDILSVHLHPHRQPHRLNPPSHGGPSHSDEGGTS